MKLTTQLLLGVTIAVGFSTASFAVCTGDVNMSGFKITDLGDPVNGEDAVNKDYVDAAFSGMVADCDDATKYGTITLGTQVWQDRNLGACRVAFDIGDHDAWGDLYQWGRQKDGHEERDRLGGQESYSRNSRTRTIQSPGIVVGHTDFIIGNIRWTLAGMVSTTLWAAPEKINNVCPAGFKVPSKQDWIDAGIIDIFDGFNKLKLTHGGVRMYDTGIITYEGMRNCYWTSTPDTLYNFTLSAGPVMGLMAQGCSVRCIKE